MTPRRVCALGVGALWLLWAALVWAQAVLPVPELRSRVIDQTGTLDAAQQAALESRLATFEARRGTQIVVDTVRETLEARLDQLLPVLEQLLLERGIRLDELGSGAPLPEPDKPLKLRNG